jgi:Homeodomain-like domain
LERLVSVGKGAARRITHARALLLADTSTGQRHTDEETVAALGTGLRTVERVRKRLVTEGFDAALNPRPSPLGPTRSRATSNARGSNALAASLPKVAATGRCSCWPTNGSCLACSIPSASRRSDRRYNHDLDPWVVPTWCLPPRANAEYVWRLEDVIQTYLLPYDPR